MVQELQQRLLELAARRTPTRPAAPLTPPAAPDAVPMDADGDGDGGQYQLPSTVCLHCTCNAARVHAAQIVMSELSSGF